MTINELIECLQTFADVLGIDAWLNTSAEHDQFWIGVTEEQISENSIDGLFLQERGWFVEDGLWTIFV